MLEEPCFISNFSHEGVMKLLKEPNLYSRRVGIFSSH